MRALVTGAAGFIGSQVVRTLVEDGDDVHAVVRPGADTARLAGVEEGVTLHRIDLDSRRDVTERLGAISPEVVYHLAWYAEPQKYLHAKEENMASLEASVPLVSEALAGGGRVVLAGTCLEGLPQRERDAFFYASAKRSLHELALHLSDERAGSSVCAHIFYLYGPDEDERRLVPSLIRALTRGEPIAVTAGEQRLPYLHVADVARALVAIGRSSQTGTIDVCSGPPTVLRDLFAAVGAELSRDDLVRVGGRPYRDDEIMELPHDPRPLRDLGWAPTFDLRTGVADTVAWWKERTTRLR